MIISQIKKGLGNQLFQYAASKSLALKNSDELRFDISSYFTDASREFGLKYFELSNRSADLTGLCAEKFKIYVESRFNFDNNFFNQQGDTYLIGYWQSEKYFKHIDSIIRKDFQVIPSYVSHLESKKQEIKSTVSVSLHIRRGDYLQYSFLGIKQLDYYYGALNILKKSIGNFKLFIFSDDINWATANLNYYCEMEFVSDHITSHAIEDFYLMQQCRHHIIANSTFSWWTAWLSKVDPAQIVIAPREWFNDPAFNTKDLIPKSWKLV